MNIRKLKNKKLELNNEGNLSLFFTGVGSAFSKKHFQTNLLIIKGKDHLLVDCGTKTPQALFELGISVNKIENFIVTHSHADHVGGLEELMLMGRYVTKKKPNIIITKAYQDILWNMSLKGGASYNEENDGKGLSFSDLWKIQRPSWVECFPRETFETNIGNLNIKLFRTNHIPENSKTWADAFWSCGLIIDDKVMFTGDTKFDKELIESFDAMFKFELIFHDCQFFTGGVHAGLEEIKDLSPELKKKIILVHYGDNWESFEEKVKEYGFKGLAKQWHYYNFK